MPLAETSGEVLPSFVDRHGWLRVHGGHLVDESGEIVVLRGVSLFWSQWMPQFYNPQLIKWLRDDWKVNVVRASMAVHQGGFLENPVDEVKKIETVIAAALRYGLYVIVDWHAHLCELPAARDFFVDIARRYARFPNLIFEPWNEPDAKYDWSADIKPYHEAVIHAVRRHDPRRLFILGTENFSQRVDKAALDPVGDTNAAYTLHFYAANHKAKLRQRLSDALAHGAGVVVTEYGTCEASGDGYFDVAETRRWWDFLQARHVSYINWSISDKTETAAVLNANAASTGGWTDSDLTPSGRLIREHLRRA